MVADRGKLGSQKVLGRALEAAVGARLAETMLRRGVLAVKRYPLMGTPALYRVLQLRFMER